MTNHRQLAAELQERIDRLLELTYASDDHYVYKHDHPKGEGHPRCPACWAKDIRAVLLGRADGRWLRRSWKRKRRGVDG